MSESSSVTLRVAEALTRDVGRGLVRLDPTDMASLSVQTGETVQIIGRRSTVAKALPAYAEDRGQSTVQMDGILRENAQSGIGDRVQMQKIVCPVARSVVIQPHGLHGGHLPLVHGGRNDAAGSGADQQRHEHQDQGRERVHAGP